MSVGLGTSVKRCIKQIKTNSILSYAYEVRMIRLTQKYEPTRSVYFFKASRYNYYYKMYLLFFIIPLPYSETMYFPHFFPIINIAVLILPDVQNGKTLASAILNPSIPFIFNFESHTAFEVH